MIVDAHAHVWAMDPETYPWRPTFGFVPTEPALPADLRAAMDRHGVAHALLVQPSAYGSDHRFLLDTIRAHPTRFLPVGLVDPADPADVARAGDLVRASGCVGFRVNLALDPDRAIAQAEAPGWAGIESLGVPISLRATPRHHDLVVGILGRHRGMTVVVDHLGLPERGQLAATAARIASLAGFEQCWLKVAGLTLFSEEGSPYRDAWPVVEAAVRSFGTARLVWGSDFPAGGTQGYASAIEALEAMPFLEGAERHRLMGENAIRLWGVPPARRSVP